MPFEVARCLLVRPCLVCFRERLDVMREPLGERHIRVDQEVVGTRGGVPLEETALQ